MTIYLLRSRTCLQIIKTFNNIHRNNCLSVTRVLRSTTWTFSQAGLTLCKPGSRTAWKPPNFSRIPLHDDGIVTNGLGQQQQGNGSHIPQHPAILPKQEMQSS